MTFQGDPHRTLGVAPGASLNEIRSAYRRLAKAYHPDAAGERALSRFLAIQAAYERLVDGEGRLRPPGSRGGSDQAQGADRGGGAAREPWRADPDRARASRNAWRARRAGGSASTGGVHGGRASGGATDAGAGIGSAGPDGTTGRSGGTSSGGSRPGAGDRHQHRRGFRKATPGSTTYDEAAGTPLDPEWGGGAWYGPSSGTFWTLNPREYADPRKHGPEYLARARRAAPGEGGESAPPDMGGAAAPATDAEDVARRWRWGGADATAPDGVAAEWGTRGWTHDTRGDPGPAWTPRTDERARRAGLDDSGAPAADAAAAADAPSLPDLEALARRAAPASLLAIARRPGRRWRLLVACIGWPPIGYALGTLASTMTGCARFSASCPEPLPMLLLLVQPLVVAVLYASPLLAVVSAFAALVALAVALPSAAVLSVGSLPRAGVEANVLGLVVLVAYLVAFVGAGIRLWDRPRPSDSTP